MSDPDLALFERIKKMSNYTNVRMLDDGTIVANSKLMFTTAIHIDMNDWGFAKRFCFEDPELAVSELMRLKTGDDEPVGWIARR